MVNSHGHIHQRERKKEWERKARERERESGKIKLPQLSLSNSSLQLNPTIASDILKQEANTHRLSVMRMKELTGEKRMQYCLVLTEPFYIRDQIHGYH